MAVSYGDVGTFFLDADAVTAGVGIPAVVADTPDGLNLSIVAAFDPARIYGPSVPSPYGFTYDPTPVTLTANPAGYYFVPSVTVSNTVAAAAASAAAAADASADASGNLTPQLLQPVISGTWTWDKDLGIWHQRFNKEEMSLYYSVPGNWVTAKFSIRDVNSVGGALTIQAYRAVRFAVPAVKVYLAAGSVTSAASGADQELALTLTQTTAESEMRFDVATGLDNGGVTIATQYQLAQMFPEV